MVTFKGHLSLISWILNAAPGVARKSTLPSKCWPSGGNGTSCAFLAVSSQQYEGMRYMCPSWGLSGSASVDHHQAIQ